MMRQSFFDDYAKILTNSVDYHIIKSNANLIALLDFGAADRA